ncbi:MAG: hypothetical protein ACYC0F_16365 [Rhodanobacter sp.]
MNETGTRKAALALASLHAADRRWMLARLSKPWRKTLGPLIRAARRFTNFDADLLQEALDGSTATTMADVPSPAVLIAVLNGLSVPWAARVLAAAATDHVEIYLAACSKLRGEAVRRELAQLRQPFPPALAQTLARRLEDAGRALVAAEGAR